MSQEELDNRAVFMELYTPINQQLSNFCYSRTNNVADAKDLISETVLRAYENFDKLKDKGVFLSFLIGIAIRIIRKKERRQKFVGIFSQKVADQIPSNNSSPELDHDVKILYNALDQLPVLQKEALILFEISGFSIKEINDLQGGSLSAIKSRISRGREKLKEILHSDRYHYSDEIDSKTLHQ